MQQHGGCHPQPGTQDHQATSRAATDQNDPAMLAACITAGNCKPIPMSFRVWSTQGQVHSIVVPTTGLQLVDALWTSSHPRSGSSPTSASCCCCSSRARAALNASSSCCLKSEVCCTRVSNCKQAAAQGTWWVLMQGGVPSAAVDYKSHLGGDVCSCVGILSRQCVLLTTSSPLIGRRWAQLLQQGCEVPLLRWHRHDATGSMFSISFKSS